MFESAKEIVEEASSGIVGIDPKTKKLIEGSELETDGLFTHGYFPKEIIRYLAMRLKDAEVPCEVGFDRELAEDKGRAAMQLRETYRDARPFYFLAIPVALRLRAKLILSETSYPIPDDHQAEQEAELRVASKRKKKAEQNFRRMMVYIVLAVVAVFGVYGFILLSNIILE